MPFGPTESDLSLLLQLPLFLSLALAISLLFSWRKVRALAGAIVALGIYIAVGLSSIHSYFGGLMLMGSGWAAVLFLLVALYLGTRTTDAQGRNG